MMKSIIKIIKQNFMLCFLACGSKEPNSNYKIKLIGIRNKLIVNHLHILLLQI